VKNHTHKRHSHTL